MACTNMTIEWVVITETKAITNRLVYKKESEWSSLSGSPWGTQ